MSEFEALMKKTKKNVALLGSSEFGTGSFVFLEEKVPGSSAIRRVFYVGKTVPQKTLDENQPLKISSVGAANKLIKKYQPNANDFAKSSGFCAGFLHKSVDQKQLMLKIIISKNCSESKLQKGLKDLSKEYKGNSFTTFIGYKSGFAAEGIASSDERAETKALRAETKKITKRAPENPQEKITYYEQLLSPKVETIQQQIGIAENASSPIPEAEKVALLDLRDKLEQALVFLGKYERTVSSVNGQNSIFGGLLAEVEAAHTSLSQKLFGEGDIDENQSKEESLVDKAKKKIDEKTGLKDIREGIQDGDTSKVVDGTLKAGKLAAKAVHKVLDTDPTGIVSSSVGMGIGIKKTIDSAGRIQNAREARKQMQESIKLKRTLIHDERAKLMARRPDPKTEQEAYNNWTLELYTLESDMESLEHLVEIQKSIQKKGAFDMLDGTLGTISSALIVSGVGGIAGVAVAGAKGAISGAKVVGEKIRDHKREGKRDERDELIANKAANKMLKRVASKRREEGKDTNDIDERVLRTELSEEQQKILADMNEIRRLRKKSRHGDKLSMREEMKLSLSANEDAAKGMQLMRKSETARTIVKATSEIQEMMLKSIGIQPKEWKQMKAIASEKVRVHFDLPKDVELEKEYQREVMKMLSEVLAIAIPSI